MTELRPSTSYETFLWRRETPWPPIYVREGQAGPRRTAGAHAALLAAVAVAMALGAVLTWLGG